MIVASGPPVIVPNYDSAVQKRTRQISWGVFGGMIMTRILAVMYTTGGRSRTAAKIVAVVLLIGGVLLFSTSAWAGTGMVEAVAGRSIWSYPKFDSQSLFGTILKKICGSFGEKIAF